MMKVHRVRTCVCLLVTAVPPASSRLKQASQGTIPSDSFHVGSSSDSSTLLWNNTGTNTEPRFEGPRTSNASRMIRRRSRAICSTSYASPY
ncbi:hypothetical protein DFH94DRAFT_346577 [Russula ochroleuca]|uniref:Secreted protein n=1 Tax=Russula ochroleuca TaxID=152965 RepID=A0A9P5MKZ5_9AGAM|nr:hypothetical protein DFH94DRAFT_346577 [Russula ochroleuca]